jgi:hypothetical protein
MLIADTSVQMATDETLTAALEEGESQLESWADDTDSFWIERQDLRDEIVEIRREVMHRALCAAYNKRLGRTQAQR